MFLCHRNLDKPEVKQIGEQLKAEGYLPWLDEWDLVPGQVWQRVLEEQIEQRKTVAVFIGADEIGLWQDMEIMGFREKAVKGHCTVIPVILASYKTEPKIPLFLNAFHRVDFRKSDPDPLQQLIRGINLKKDV